MAALSSQTQREVDGLSSANAEEVASVRRELKEALVLLGRRVEEVRARCEGMYILTMPCSCDVPSDILLPIVEMDAVFIAFFLKHVS